MQGGLSIVLKAPFRVGRVTGPTSNASHGSSFGAVSQHRQVSLPLPPNRMFAEWHHRIGPALEAAVSEGRDPENHARSPGATPGSSSEPSPVGPRVSFRHRALIFALLAGIFGLLQIHQALDQGRLAFPITYDDTGYFRDALSRLHAVFDRGVLAFFQDWWNSPPKSPWSTLVAFTGFAILGPHDWSPAAANVVALMLMAVALAGVLRTLPLWIALVILVALLTWPYFGSQILDVRPDMVWGIALAAFAAVVATGATTDFSRRRILVAASLLTLVLLTKITTLPISFAVVGTVCFATLAVRWQRRSDTFRQHALALAVVFAIAALAALPHYAIGLRGIYRYVIANTLGEQARVWDLELERYGHVMYYLTGPGGQTMMRAWLWLWLMTFMLFAANLVQTRDRITILRSVCFAAGFFVAFIAVSVPAHKSPYIGAVVPAFFLVSWTLMSVHLLSAAQSASTRSVAAGFLVLATAVGLATFHWQSTIGFGRPSAERYTEIAKRRADVADVLNALERAQFNGRELFVAGAAPYLNADTLGYYALKRRRDEMRFADALLSDAPDQIAARIDASDGVLLFTPDYPDVIPWLPSSRSEYRVRAAEHVMRDPQLNIALTLPSLAGAGQVQLYLRKPAFQVGTEATGFGLVEGPYPQWGLPIVRWGLGPASRFTIADEEPTRLLLQAQTPHPNQVMTVIVDGVELMRFSFRGVDRPEQIVVELPPARGSRRSVELRYSAWTAGSASDPRKMAVLFRGIQWQ